MYFLSLGVKGIIMLPKQGNINNYFVLRSLNIK